MCDESTCVIIFLSLCFLGWSGYWLWDTYKAIDQTTRKP